MSSIDFNEFGLRQMLAAVLLTTIFDVAIGLPDEFDEAVTFMGNPLAENYAQGLGLPWPPTEEQITAVRLAYLDRLRQSKCKRLRVRYQRIVQGDQQWQLTA